MPKAHLIKIPIAAMAMAACVASPSHAQQSTPVQSYSATAVHDVPGQPGTTGTVIKSGQNMRLEFEKNGQKIIQILLPEQGVMYILEPATRTYLAMRGPAVPATLGAGNATPCREQSNLAMCRQVGTDTVSGIQVEHWLLASGPQTKPLSILWDPTRRQALRQDFPDGSAVVMRFKDMQTLNGRATEHWTLQIQAPERETLTGGWWFDPELRVVVREELPGGEVRHLENIQVGVVDGSAFQLPDGWQQRDPSAIAAPQVPQLALQPATK